MSISAIFDIFGILFVFFRKTDKRIEELVLTEREYVKSLNYVITVSINFNPLKDFIINEKMIGIYHKIKLFFLLGWVIGGTKKWHQTYSGG